MTLEQWFIRLMICLLSSGPLVAAACARPTDDGAIPARRLTPLIKAGEQAPLKQTIVIGSVHAYLVPQQAVVEVQTIRQGMIAPLQILSNEAVERLSRRFRFASSETPASVLPGTKWIYVFSSSFGKSELRMTDSSGWKQVVELGMVYPQPQPRNDPTQLRLDEGGYRASFDVDANSNTLWLSVPGLLKDGWRMSEGSETGFDLMRMEQLAVPYGDPALVGMFFVGSRSLRSGQIRIDDAGLPRKSFTFNVRARPTPLC